MNEHELTASGSSAPSMLRAVESFYALFINGHVRKLLFVVIAGVGILAAFFMGSGWKRFVHSEESWIYHTATAGDLSIIVSERGTLESRHQTEIKCEVENLGYETTGNVGTQILFIVPNGKSVKKGELLVSLDSTGVRERLDAQILAHEQAKAAQIQATSKYENQKTQNKTAANEAEVKLKLAEMELRMYEDERGGTHQIAVQDLNLKIQEAKDHIADAQTALAMRGTEREGITQLFRLGYRGKGDLQQAAYNYQQAEDTLVRAINALANANSNRQKLEQYDYPMQKLKLESAVETAQGALEQVRRDNESALAQAEAIMVAAEQSLKKEKEKLDRYTAQLEKCKIYAPHDGMVAYADSPGSPIAEGSFVNQRQKILSLPDLTKMNVKTAIHESMTSEVRAGLSSTITLESVIGQTYRGTVESIAVLPKPGNLLQSEIKTYETIVNIDDPVDQLKPGMTVLVQIDVEQLKGIVSIPVQAVLQIGQEYSCYVKTSRGPKRRPITLGRTNDKFVEIRHGLDAGETVVLNPTEILDQDHERVPLPGS